VAGLGVDRLDLTPVPLAGPGVEQQAVAGQRRGVVGREHGQVTSVEDDVAPDRLRSPESRSKPACVQAFSAPSRMRTLPSPAHLSSHQARAAARPPLLS
jgi:hypothetical protein